MEFLYYKPTFWELLTASCAVAFLIIQVLYYFCVYGKVAFKRKKRALAVEKTESELPAVSIVIATKNEQNFLKDNLGLFLEQDYPEFEVIVVNDASNDETEYILKAFSKLYPNLKVVNIVENVNKFRGRKFPIALGIKSAKYENLIISGADCTPKDFSWLRAMAYRFENKTELLLGYVSYKKTKGLRNLIFQYDNATETMNSLGWALCGLPYRGNGKNIAYRKETFFRVGGFTKHYNLTLGEDDIFVSQIADSKNTAVVLQPESFIYAQPKRTYKEWKTEKKMRLSTKTYYKPSVRFLLSLLPCSTFLFYCALAALLILGFPFEYLILALLIKFTPQLIIYFKACKRFEIKIIAIFAPLFEIFFLVFNAKIRLSSILRKKKRWN